MNHQISDKAELPKPPIISISSLQDLKTQTHDLFLSATRTIQIYTHGLDPRILNNRDMEKVLTKFIKKSRSSQLQILIYDEHLLRGIDHRLVALAQRFTSYVQIRMVPRDYHENLFGFYLVDDRRMLHRTNFERYEAERMAMPHFLIREKSKLFNTIWQASPPASFLRALNL